MRIIIAPSFLILPGSTILPCMHSAHIFRLEFCDELSFPPLYEICLMD